MKVALVSTYASPDAIGLRFISSFLKAAGHQVKMIFMTVKRSESAQRSYPAEVIEQVVEKLRDVDLIGVGLMTNTYYQACELTAAIKAAGIAAPVVWGGVHPTVAPDSCIDHADAVCVGEGEHPLLDVANALQDGRDYTETPNLWIRRDGRVVRNEVRRLFEDLDQLPFPDYDLSDEHYLLHKGRLVPAEPKKMRGCLVRYRLLTTRGCPYACAFCCNSTWLKVYKGKGSWVRKRSIGNVIDELEEMKQRFDTIDSVSIVDDTFFVRSEEEFEEFAELYKQRIGLPFEINTHPATINRRKIEILHDCGCGMVKMGIQSGSQRTNYEIFNRRVPNDVIVNAMNILSEFPRLKKEYHYIVSNPFEPEEDMVETLHFTAEHHPAASRALIFPLALFPGSRLHQRAKEEGKLEDEQREIYERVYTGKAKRRFDRLGYLTMLLYAVVSLKQRGYSARFCHKLVNLMTARSIRSALDRSWFKYLVVALYFVGRSVRGTIYQLFFRPFRKHKRRYLLAAEA